MEVPTLGRPWATLTMLLSPFLVTNIPDRVLVPVHAHEERRLPAQPLLTASPRTSAREPADIFMSQSCEGLPEPAFAGEVITASVTATRLGQNTLLRILHTAGGRAL